MKDLCVAVPFHTKKNAWLEECLMSIRMSSDNLEIIGIDDSSNDGARKIAETYCDQIITGPGLCNWRPGAIHWPVLQAWLTTKCPFITYMFSDDCRTVGALSKQVAFLKTNPRLSASYCNTLLINSKGETISRVVPSAVPTFGGIPTFAESLVIRKETFEEEGGLDFPIHIAAMAEAWIWAAAGAAGRVQHLDIDGLKFREHPDTLSSSGKSRYIAATKETKFFEEDHWKLWRRVEPKFHYLVNRARNIQLLCL